MTAVDVLPVAESLGQVAPRNARAVAVEHGLDKQTVVPGGDADGALATGQEVAKGVPLVIAKGIAASAHGQELSLRQKGRRESSGTAYGSKIN